MLLQHNVTLIVVDEGDLTLRKRNDSILTGLKHEYYGPSERERWFKERFGGSCQKYLEVIPKKCHAETSFGFLVAYEENPDVIIELDDDVLPVRESKLVDWHLENLFNDAGVTVNSRGEWYNTIENLELKTASRPFPRGHPYLKEARSTNYNWVNNGGKCVLNMGLWTGNLDLDALTILYNSGINGRLLIEANQCKRSKVIVEEGTYFAVCSMNTAFLSKIIPAFYQLYMNFMTIDRFDDIWSGIFLKKITDHLGDKVCLGHPIVYHNKRPRNVFGDLRKELEGLIVNEVLWRIVNEIELDGNSYWDCYRSLIDGLKNTLDQFKEDTHRKFIQAQVEKMEIWLEIVDELL